MLETISRVEVQSAFMLPKMNYQHWIRIWGGRRLEFFKNNYNNHVLEKKEISLINRIK